MFLYVEVSALPGGVADPAIKTIKPCLWVHTQVKHAQTNVKPSSSRQLPQNHLNPGKLILIIRTSESSPAVGSSFYRSLLGTTDHLFLNNLFVKLSSVSSSQTWTICHAKLALAGPVHEVWELAKLN